MRIKGGVRRFFFLLWVVFVMDWRELRGQCFPPLPISLYSFFGECLGGEVHLRWVTASEENVDYYRVERSSFYLYGFKGGSGRRVFDESGVVQFGERR